MCPTCYVCTTCMHPTYCVCGTCMHLMYVVVMHPTGVRSPLHLPKCCNPFAYLMPQTLCHLVSFLMASLMGARRPPMRPLMALMFGWGYECWPRPLDPMQQKQIYIDKAWIVRRSRTPSIFYSMTWTMSLALQSVGFGRVNNLALSFSLNRGERCLFLKKWWKP